MQYPVELPGVNNMVFLRTALNAVRTARGETVWERELARGDWRIRTVARTVLTADAESSPL